MEIQTNRLHLRDLLAGDCAALHQLRTDPRVYCFNHFGPETPAETRAWLHDTIHHNNLTPRLAHNCAITLRATGELIGWIGFGQASPAKSEFGEIDFGYAILPVYWGQGYATEALSATVDFIFNHIHATQIFGECNVANPASARVMEKVGLQRIAHFVDPAEPVPERASSYRYAITRMTWAAQRASAVSDLCASASQL
jgi:[ribosomal protein S5]-alanine N-acetyltransferase